MRWLLLSLLVLLAALLHCAAAEPITIGAVIGAVYTAVSIVITLVSALIILIKVFVYYGLAIVIFIYFVENVVAAFNFALKFSLSAWLLDLLLRTLTCEPKDPTNLNVDPSTFIPQR